jgi:hypothetical protein
MAEAVNPADWGAAPVDGPASWGAVPVEETPSRMPAAIADIPKEISSAAVKGIQNLTGNAVEDLPGFDPRSRSELGSVEGLMRTGRQVLGVPELIMSPLVGTARSVGGHLLADTESVVGPYVEKAVQKITGRERSTPAPTPEQMYEAAKGDIDLAMAGARPSVPKAPTLTAPTIPELKAAAKVGYESPEVAAVNIKSQAITDFADKTSLELNNLGIDDILAPKTFGLLSRLQKAPGGSTITGANIQTARKAFGNAAGSPDPTERLAAKTVIDKLDELLPNLSSKDVISGDVGAAAKILEEARGNYSAAKRAESIDNKTIQAELRAAAANSGQNVANTVRQRMADILLKPKEQRGFSENELSQMEEIVRGSKSGNALRAAGNLLGGGGGLGAAVSAGIGGLVTGGPGAVAPVVGFGLKQLSNRLTLKQTERLSEAIRMRAPLASSASKFDEAFANFHEAKTPKAYAGVVIAARNLASNLEDPSLKASISSLLRDLHPSTRQGE